MRKWQSTRTPGIYVLDENYIIRKTYLGVSIYESTGIKKGRGKLTDVEAILDFKMAEIRNAKKMGVRGRTLFLEAAAEYCARNQHKKQIASWEAFCMRVVLYVGDVPIDQLHQNHPQIQQLIADLRAGTPLWGHGRGHEDIVRPRKRRTVWRYLEIVGRVLRFSMNDWRDDKNQPYLAAAPTFKIDDIPDDTRVPHAITWTQHKKFLKLLAPHNQRLYLFDVNTGLRDREITSLRHEWIHNIEGVGLVAVIPATWDGEPITKGGRYDRVMPLNRVARSVYEECKDDHPEFVFTFRGEPITRVVNTSWNASRIAMHEKDPAFPDDLRFHDVRHTFGHRLKEAGVDELTRKALLGHKSSDITEHYSQDDVGYLLKSVEKITKKTTAVPLLSLTKIYKKHQR